MKKTIFLMLAISLIFAFPINAQFDNLIKKAKDKVQEKIDNKEDKTVDKVVNGENNTDNKTTSLTANQNSDVNKTLDISDYKNYDFVPGDKIIFESQLVDEEVGEIPSQFTLSNGQLDVQLIDGENVIRVPKGSGATFTPRMNNTAYMPDQFTIELDFKNEEFGLNHLMVDFGQRVYYSGGEGITPGMTFGSHSINWTLGDVNYPPELDKNLDKPLVWHHIAIAINKNVGKVYVDQYRIVSVNNLTGKPNNITIDVNGYENSYIRNVRIAAGGINIYKEVTTATKIVTHGILFDVDKATIKPQSMGTINEIFRVLQKDPSLKFEIDGHTDNTGDAKHNMDLSLQRAESVKAELVSLGIDTSRLNSKGYGDTKPIDSNDTPEGKANNRRVEFVKM